MVRVMDTEMVDSFFERPVSSSPQLRQYQNR